MDALQQFVDTLKDDSGRYLIDGIGLQAHLYTSDSLTSYFYVLDKLAETGLKIQLTELDICLGKYMSSLPASEDNFKIVPAFVPSLPLLTKASKIIYNNGCYITRIMH